MYRTPHCAAVNYSIISTGGYTLMSTTIARYKILYTKKETARHWLSGERWHKMESERIRNCQTVGELMCRYRPICYTAATFNKYCDTVNPKWKHKGCCSIPTELHMRRVLPVWCDVCKKPVLLTLTIYTCWYINVQRAHNISVLYPILYCTAWGGQSWTNVCFLIMSVTFRTIFFLSAVVQHFLSRSLSRPYSVLIDKWHYLIHALGHVVHLWRKGNVKQVLGRGAESVRQRWEGGAGFLLLPGKNEGTDLCDTKDRRYTNDPERWKNSCWWESSSCSGMGHHGHSRWPHTQASLIDWKQLNWLQRHFVLIKGSHKQMQVQINMLYVQRETYCLITRQ